MINEALWIENGDGAAVAHRVVISGPPCLTVIDGRRQRAVPVRGVDLHFHDFVPQADLTEAAPLSPCDELEYQCLDRELAGTIGDARKLKRFNALRLRSLLFGDGSGSTTTKRKAA